MTTVFDAAGNVIRTVDALNSSSTMTYDALNRQVSTQDPTGGINTTSYDAADNVTQTTDPLNHSTSYAFDGLNRQTSATDARGGITTTRSVRQEVIRLAVNSCFGNLATDPKLPDKDSNF